MNGTARVGVLTLGCAVLLMIPLLATPVLPLIDFYNHIARYYVLSHLDEARLAANYASAWALLPNLGLDALATPQIGRASCRERVCQYVLISVVAVTLKKELTKNNQHTE